MWDDHNKMITFDHEMTNTRYTYHKDKLTKWLLSVTLFFSIFIFSGYAGNSQSRQQQKTQTEIVISDNLKTCKRTISLKKAFELISYNDLLISPYKNWTNALFAFNIITKVKLDNNSRQFCSQKFAPNFFQVKTNPQSSDEDIFGSYIG